MCGFIAAIGAWPHHMLHAALDSLQQRGPDDRGQWSEGSAWLGHRRLSVIDISDAGHQPMTTDDGRYVIIFNGEIYNFVELREALTAENWMFKGNSDTEVLLKSLVAWGPQHVLPRIDGIFAFALWDTQRQRLIAARDRFGIKPLFFTLYNMLIVSSTMVPFWHLRGFPRRLNYKALRDYLSVRYIPAPNSILKDVSALEPGCWFEWSAQSQRLIRHRYWDIPGPLDQAMASEELIERTESALAESVKRQLVADVPLGAFLSGGIDSSLMVHYMAQAGVQPIRTFSVSFPEFGAYDESNCARQVAKHYGTEHHEFDARELNGTTVMRSIDCLDQPLADEAFLPTLALSEMTRQFVTVALSGDGGDELFGGYGRFLETEQCWPDNAMYASTRWLHRMGLLPGSLIRRSLRGIDRVVYNNLFLGPYRKGRKAMAPLLTEAAGRRCHIEQTMERWRRLTLRFSNTMNTDSLMRADLWTYLSDNCLVKTDRASMAHSLEVRVPMLGNSVVDLILPQPASVKINSGLKHLLVELAQRHLPREVWDRPKHGFSVPLRQYFTGSWQKSCDELIDAAPDIASFLNPECLRQRWNACKHGRGEARVMYALIVLLRWLSKYPVDSDSKDS